MTIKKNQSQIPRPEMPPIQEMFNNILTSLRTIANSNSATQTARRSSGSFLNHEQIACVLIRIVILAFKFMLAFEF